jgi:hypothetical protein
MITIPRNVEQWMKAVFAAFVGGFCNAFLSACGITVANAVGVTMPQLAPRQLLDIAVFGGITSALMYLKTSPVPPGEGNTIVWKNPNPPVPPAQQDQPKQP